MDWLAARDQVPGTRGKVYLNSCSMGLPHEATLAAVQQYLQGWTGLGAAAWHERWVDAIGDWRAAVARLIGAQPRQVAWTPSVSAGLASLGSSLGTARPELVLARLEFPAALAAMGLRPGTSVRWVEGDGPVVPALGYAQAIGPQTRAVVASRVLFSTGARQDAASIMASAREAGAFGIVDDYQATGQAPLDVDAVACDAAVGGSLKWLCGGVASCWLYVRRPEALEPTHAGWWANARMFDFDGFEFWPDARRFEGGEANVPGVLASTAALGVLQRHGQHRVAARVMELASDLADKLTARGVALRLPPEGHRTGIIMVPRKDAPADVAALARKGIIVDDRAGCLRLSTHWYNTEQDNDALVAALR